MISCAKSNIEGSYYYVEPNKKDNTNIYTSMGCSMVEVIKLDNGYYYNGITGENMRFKYEVVDDKVIIESQGFELVFNIIDENTIEFRGCLFKKKLK